MILKAKANDTTEQTYRRGAALCLEDRIALKELVESVGMRSVADMAECTEQTVGKGVLGEPLYKCSRRRLRALLIKHKA